jgi:5-amino-6-(5-phosphoribosylamino)uracil reductase
VAHPRHPDSGLQRYTPPADLERDLVTERPYVELSCAISADGCLDAPGPDRLILSGPADADRVDGERAIADAILVGAGTIRRDDPRLLVRSAARCAARVALGQPAQPLGVTVTASGDLDPGARFFAAAQGAERLVYCPAALAAALARRLGGSALVAGAGEPRLADGSAVVVGLAEPVLLADVLTDLARRGVGRLMVEGGAVLGREFLAGGLVDELDLVVAPFFVGGPAAPRFAGPAAYPHSPDRPMIVAGVNRLDDVVLLRYLLGKAGPPGRGGQASAADRRWLLRAVEESRRCPPASSAFSVGAFIVGAGGELLATGYSREGGPHDHAEEVALAKLGPANPRLAGATLYSSLEPCRYRRSRPRPCAELIAEAGLRRVVIAWLEPPLFAPGGGAGLLREAGVTVVEVPELAARARAINAAVLPG